MLEVVTLYTLLIWAEPRSGSRALAVSQVLGFVSEESCNTAARAITEANDRAQASAPTGWRASGMTGMTGIDIKLIACVPVSDAM